MMHDSLSDRRKIDRIEIQTEDTSYRDRDRSYRDRLCWGARRARKSSGQIDIVNLHSKLKSKKTFEETLKEFEETLKREREETLKRVTGVGSTRNIIQRRHDSSIRDMTHQEYHPESNREGHC
jgi:hypothetical protein